MTKSTIFCPRYKILKNTYVPISISLIIEKIVTNQHNPFKKETSDFFYILISLSFYFGNTGFFLF